MINKNLQAAERSFNSIFIIENRDYWKLCRNDFNIASDLALTIDFAVKKEVESVNGYCEFLDHLADHYSMNDLNYKMLDYLDRWYIKDGEDLFKYREIEFGNSFKLNILNDITYNVHFLTNLLCLKEIKYQNLICASSDQCITDLMTALGFSYQKICLQEKTILPEYYFPIGKWMKQALEKRSVLDFFLNTLEYFKSIKYRIYKDTKPSVYINNYFPTRKLIQSLRSDNRVNLILNFYSGLRNVLVEDRLVFPSNKIHSQAKNFEDLFESIELEPLLIGDYNFAPRFKKLIRPIFLRNLSKCLVCIDRIVSYFRHRNLKLMIPVTDLWLENRLIMNYCKNRNIPVYMIINGLLTNNSFKDGFDSTWVNSYGNSIKEDYYLNASNVVCLGDSRMDVYSSLPKKSINLLDPVVLIGASGYNPIDLNSYLAVEYDFLYDILGVLNTLSVNRSFKIIIKVRANGYASTYQKFVEEYFNHMNIEIIQNLPFTEVLQKADLYISIYSQTHFEAAALGIPSIYYKKDTESNNRPFDCRSELVTAVNRKELKEKINLFLHSDKCFEEFMKNDIIKKYIGPIDGQNSSRNISFIYSLLN